MALFLLDPFPLLPFWQVGTKITRLDEDDTRRAYEDKVEVRVVPENRNKYEMHQKCTISRSSSGGVKKTIRVRLCIL